MPHIIWIFFILKNSNFPSPFHHQYNPDKFLSLLKFSLYMWLPPIQISTFPSCYLNCHLSKLYLQFLRYSLSIEGSHRNNGAVGGIKPHYDSSILYYIFFSWVDFIHKYTKWMHIFIHLLNKVLQIFLQVFLRISLNVWIHWN